MYLNAPLGDYSSILHRSLGKMKIKNCQVFWNSFVFFFFFFFFCVLESISGQSDLTNCSFLEPDDIF